MKSAPMVTVGEVIVGIEAGKSVKAQGRPAGSDELGILKISAVTWGTFKPEENKAVLPDYDPGGCPRPRDGDVLISRANTKELVGAPVRVAGNFPNLLLPDKILRLNPDHKLIEPAYLVRALQAPLARRHFSKSCGGTSGSMANITQGDIRSAPIPLPPLPEQRRIAAILDKADALCAKRREAIAKCDQLLQSVFLDMFGDPVTNPKGWAMTSIGEHADFINGDRGKNYPSRIDFLDSGIPFINAGHIQKGKVTYDEMNFISEEKYRKLGGGKINKGDLLYCLRGSLGKCAIVDSETPGAIASSLVIIRPMQTLSAGFLFRYLQTPFADREMRSYDNGSSQPNLSAASVKKFRLLLPPIEEQLRFQEVETKLQEQRSIIDAQLRELEQLFKSLQKSSFSGQLNEAA